MNNPLQPSDVPEIRRKHEPGLRKYCGGLGGSPKLVAETFAILEGELAGKIPSPSIPPVLPWAWPQWDVSQGSRGPADVDYVHSGGFFQFSDYLNTIAHAQFLLGRIITGNDMDVIVRIHHDKLQKYCTVKYGSERSKDMTQESFRILLEQVQKRKPSDPLPPPTYKSYPEFGRYLRQIAEGHWMNIISKRDYGEQALGEHADLLPGREPDFSMSDVLDSLEPDDREILTLCYFVGLAAYAVAERLGVSISAAKGRLFRAKQHLRSFLER